MRSRLSNTLRLAGGGAALVLLGACASAPSGADAVAAAVEHRGDARSTPSAEHTAAATTSGRTFRASADAFVRADRRRTNFGRLRALRTTARPLTRSFVRFTVRGLTGEIASAVLRLRVTSRSPGRLNVHAVRDTSWRERGITFGSSPRLGRLVGSARGVAGRWTSIDVTSAVAGNGVVTLALTSARRGGVRAASRETGANAPRLVVTTTSAPQPPSGPLRGPTAVLVAAGDVAYGGSGDDQTAALLDTIDPTVIATLGDNAYDSGTAEEFASWYAPTWGRHKAKTRPSPGNHEYKTPGASGYFDYFGAAAGERGKGWYSYDVGAWHLIALNTNGPDACETISCSPASEQERWLRADLASTRKSCVLAYFHHPRFSTGPHGDHPGVAPLWQALYDHGVEVVLQGHDHNYQRWVPMTPSGEMDATRGIRSFVVGTGGKNLYPVGARTGLTAKQGDTLGVLKLTLGDGAYEWEFVPVAGETYADSGTGSCR
jgi:hypothetical protein